MNRTGRESVLTVVASVIIGVVALLTMAACGSTECTTCKPGGNAGDKFAAICKAMPKDGTNGSGTAKNLPILGTQDVKIDWDGFSNDGTKWTVHAKVKAGDRVLADVDLTGNKSDSGIIVKSRGGTWSDTLQNVPLNPFRYPIKFCGKYSVLRDDGSGSWTGTVFSGSGKPLIDYSIDYTKDGQFTVKSNGADAGNANLSGN